MLIPFISLQFSWNTAVIQKNTIKYILFKILPSKSSGGEVGVVLKKYCTRVPPTDGVNFTV